MGADVDSYHYLPLSHRTSIRLVRVLPDVQGDPIRIEIHTAEIATACGSYDAISYTWGDAGGDHYALVDGKPLPLRYNIYRFLEHCRDTPLRTRLKRDMWIDAISINQNDHAEKSEQVAVMGSIYANAHQTVAWLVGASEDMTITWLLEATNAASVATLPNNSTCPISKPEVHSPTIDTSMLRRVFRVHNEQQQSRAAQAYHQLLIHPYWSRLWIVQELQLSKRACIISGHLILQVEAVIDMIDLAGEVSILRLDGVFSLDVQTVMRVTTAAGRGVNAAEDTGSLARMLHRYNAFECQDRRDHVYGLIGLISWELRIDVDYTMSAPMLALVCLEVENKRMQPNLLDRLWEILAALRLTVEVVMKDPVVLEMLYQAQYMLHVTLEELYIQDLALDGQETVFRARRRSDPAGPGRSLRINKDDTALATSDWLDSRFSFNKTQSAAISHDVRAEVNETRVILALRLSGRANSDVLYVLLQNGRPLATSDPSGSWAKGYGGTYNLVKHDSLMAELTASDVGALVTRHSASGTDTKDENGGGIFLRCSLNTLAFLDPLYPRGVSSRAL
jgi:hypothetical protein